MTTTLPPSVIAARDSALALVCANAGPEFIKKAREIMLKYLRVNGETSGEDLADCVKGWGVIPHTDKAFGPVIASLKRDGLIERAGYCQRKKGHGTSGGVLWRLKVNEGVLA